MIQKGSSVEIFTHFLKMNFVFLNIWNQSWYILKMQSN